VGWNDAGRNRPPRQVVIRSATPQLSKNVPSLTVGYILFEKSIISRSPIRMIAAFEFVP
jgi:hypothetical protein